MSKLMVGNAVEYSTCQNLMLFHEKSVADGLITGAECHIASLTLAEVAEDPVIGPIVGVPVLLADRSREGENHPGAGGRTYTALLLAAEMVVDVLTAGVDPVPFEIH